MLQSHLCLCPSSPPLFSALATVEGSVVYHTGNVLLMAALAYALLFTALKYGQIQLYPDW